MIITDLIYGMTIPEFYVKIEMCGIPGFNLKTNMDSGNNIPQKEKIDLIRQAFDRFMKKMEEIKKRQNELFEDIMGRINERKLDEQRKKIDEAYAKKVEEAFKKKHHCG